MTILPNLPGCENVVEDSVTFSLKRGVKKLKTFSCTPQNVMKPKNVSMCIQYCRSENSSLVRNFTILKCMCSNKLYVFLYMFFKNSHILVQQSCFVRKLQKSRTNLILQSLDKILLWRKPNNYKRALMFNLFKILVQNGTEWKSCENAMAWTDDYNVFEDDGRNDCCPEFFLLQ